MRWGRPVADITSVAHTGFTVADLQRSLAFDRDVLGFEVVMEQEKQGGYLAEIVGYEGAHVRMAHVKLPGSEHGIELFQYVTPPSAPREGEPRDVGPTHICLVVDDLPAVYERLRAAGVGSFFSSPVEVDTGANRGGCALYLRDPDGIILELFQPPKSRSLAEHARSPQEPPA
jgi:catechol 2,3-dioxygenase-like lactoylglutathione lyase family enzyme